ncbi:hypothetical protein BJX70DRAFT_402633 [Aspergillus crustosus]
MYHHCGVCHGVLDGRCEYKSHMLPCPIHPTCYQMKGADCKTCRQIETYAIRREREEREQAPTQVDVKEEQPVKLSKAKASKAKRHEQRKLLETSFKALKRMAKVEKDDNGKKKASRGRG